ncbi:hypothetical protein E1B28_000877 [Marasmius oreades]|uniref:C3H1-type domain-containing protein n=1 Tax=Marasmius oreades TaxID=181124 RepID=A0A9P7V283_9AGAR|nr:uncharacterized protein E1B28_000877 [Marasmius oreades]KAG7098991.1 hypothetical protein E1B28_000877 [Marasmius oreades]
MVSALIAAAAEGRLENVVEILCENTSININGKDEQGAIAVVEAVKNGHVEVVRVLLEKGADSALALNLTQDPSMLELLNQSRSYPAQSQEKSFYPQAPPPGAPAGYAYYQPHPLPEGAVFYPPPPHDPHHTQNPTGGPGNLPPPEIARLIPCRYFPACRYGSSCIFAHPQGPYFQGPLPPPAQYPAPYDPMSQQNYSPNYYPISPPSFQPQPPPANGVPMNTLPSSPPPSMSQVPSSSELSSPPPPPFTPNGAPVQLPYQPMVGPSPYPPHHGQPGNMPLAPPPVQPVYHPSPPQGQPQSPPAMYHGTPNGTSAPGPFVLQANVVSTYSGSAPVPYSDGNTALVKSPHSNPLPENFPPGPPRDNFGLHRRGGARRGSFGARPKPPCLFFPAGKCKNGDDCRFPHILPENNSITQQYFSGRGGAPRAPRAHLNGHTGLEQKMSNLSVRDAPRSPNGNDSNSKPDNRPRHGFGHRNLLNNAAQQSNGKRPLLPKQRLPNADDFPVLAGSTTPPSSKAINGFFNHVNGPTAAQILQAPPPPTKSTSSNVTRTTSPDSTSSAKDSRAEINGTVPSIAPDEQFVKPAPPSKLPISFAAVTASAPTATSNVPEAPVEVYVSA